MIGSFLTRGMTLMLGYLYPAYECFKCVEKNRPELDNLRFWCEYWMIIAIVTVLERVGGDALISWLPLYSEAKLAFIVYLWYPKTKGTTYVYATFVRPVVAQYENEIDGNLGELRARAGEILAVYWQRGSTIFQTRFLEVLQFLAAQSPGRVNYPAPSPASNVYPPRLPPAARLQAAASGSESHQPSAPAPPPGYPNIDLSGYAQGPAGLYPAPPPGYPSLLTRAGPSGGGSTELWSAPQVPQAPQAPPPPPGYTGGPRSRSRVSISEEEDEFELVDKNLNFPDEAAGPNGYMTRARQRALGADRGRGGDRGAGSTNLYSNTGASGGNNNNKS